MTSRIYIEGTGGTTLLDRQRLSESRKANLHLYSACGAGMKLGIEDSIEKFALF